MRGEFEADTVEFRLFGEYMAVDSKMDARPTRKQSLSIPLRKRDMSCKGSVLAVNVLSKLPECYPTS